MRLYRSTVARTVLLGVSLSLAVPPFALAPLTASARPAPDSFADLAAKLLPGVVNVSSSRSSPQRGGPGAGPGYSAIPARIAVRAVLQGLHEPQPPGQRGDPTSRAPERRAQSLGSGFIIDPSGIIVTNNHVIDGADEITVILQDNTTLKAKLVGRDESARPRAAEGEFRQAAARGVIRRFRTRRGSATGCWRSAIRSAWAAR